MWDGTNEGRGRYGNDNGEFIGVCVVILYTLHACYKHH